MIVCDGFVFLGTHFILSEGKLLFITHTLSAILYYFFFLFLSIDCFNVCVFLCVSVISGHTWKKWQNYSYV